jgi:hypothetical protein
VRNVKSAFVIIYDAFLGVCGMPLRNEWEEKAANLLKAEIKRKGLTYAQVVEKLAEIGVSEDERNIRNKVSRGKFTAAFLLQCLSAIGSQEIRL